MAFKFHDEMAKSLGIDRHDELLSSGLPLNWVLEDLAVQFDGRVFFPGWEIGTGTVPRGNGLHGITHLSAALVKLTFLSHLCVNQCSLFLARKVAERDDSHQTAGMVSGSHLCHA